jgi:arylformamidase
MHGAMTDWDDAYANAAYIAGSERWPAAWDGPARAYRASMLAAGRARLDVPYGPGPRQQYDLFLPTESPRGLMTFVHGGYWLAFDKSSWSHFAAGAVARGYAVALPSYRLCPEVRIATIADDVAAAMGAAAAQFAGPIMLAGHSAGGQLAARLATTTAPLAPALRQRLRRVTAISGLHDLKPLMLTKMNATLRIDAGEALRESPAFLKPLPDIAVTAWVGANERPEFIRQNAVLGDVWPGITVRQAPARHHYDVLDPMVDPHSDLMDAILGR